MTTDKLRLVPLTDPAEIASAERNGLHDVIAAKYGDHWYAETDQLEHWRKQQRCAVNGPASL